MATPPPAVFPSSSPVGTSCRARRAGTSVLPDSEHYLPHHGKSGGFDTDPVPTRATARCAVDHNGSDAGRREDEARRDMAAKVEGVEVSGPDVPRSDEVLTPEALELVALLHRELGARRRELLGKR